jgi:hypothetical protein
MRFNHSKFQAQSPGALPRKKFTGMAMPLRDATPSTHPAMKPQNHKNERKKWRCPNLKKMVFLDEVAGYVLLKLII